MTMNENKIVIRKHRAIIQMTNVKAVQRKSYNILLKKAYDQKGNDLFEVSLSELKEIAGIKDTSNKNLKQSIIDLMKTIVQMDIINGSPDHWKAVPLLGETEIENGTVYFDLPRSIKSALYDPDRYAAIDLSIIKGLRSKYAIALYELARDYEKKEIPKMKIESFRKLMGVEDNKYKNFADLKRSVIDKAIGEINELSSINFTMSVEPIKGYGRAIKELKFKIIKNSHKQKELPVDAYRVSGTNRTEFSDPKIFKLEIVEMYKGKALVNRVPGYLPEISFSISNAGYICRTDTDTDISGDDAKKIWRYLFDNQERVGVIDTIGEIETIESNLKGKYSLIIRSNALGENEEIKFYPESIDSVDDKFLVIGKDEFDKTGRISFDLLSQLKTYAQGLKK